MTNLRKTLLMTSLAGVLFSGCKEDKAKSNQDKAPTSAKTTAKALQEEAKPTTSSEQTMARFQECWDAYNAKDEATFKDCFDSQSAMEIVDSTPPKLAKGTDAALAMAKDYWQAFPDIHSQPQLVLVNDKNAVAILHTTGTNRGPLMAMPATGKSISLLQASTSRLTPEGKVEKAHHWIDTGTMLHQLGIQKSEHAPDSESAWTKKITVMASDSSLEQDNLALARKMAEHITEGEYEAYLALVDDTISFRYIGDKEVMKGLEAYKKGLDMWIEMADYEGSSLEEWAAGDWVVAVSDMKATLKKDMPGAKGSKGKTVATKQLELMKFAKGKLTTHWVFENTGAYAAQLGLMDPDMAKTTSSN